MKFVMLIYHPEGVLPREELNRVHRECRAWHEELVRTGQSLGAFGLQPASTAATLREAAGKITVTDGPFAETKEVLGGFEMLECETREETLAICHRFPAIRYGASVELRPLVPGNRCEA